jgi:hypothetical protein
MRTHALTNPSSGNPVGEPQQFNLMFASSIGPTGQHPGCVLLWFIFSFDCVLFLALRFCILVLLLFVFVRRRPVFRLFLSISFIFIGLQWASMCLHDGYVRWHVRLADAHNYFMGISQNDDALSARR